MKRRWLFLTIYTLVLSVSLLVHADDGEAFVEEADAAASDHAVSSQETADEFKSMANEEGVTEEAVRAPASKGQAEDEAPGGEELDKEEPPPEDNGPKFKSVHTTNMEEEKPSKSNVKNEPVAEVEDRQKLLDQTDSDCFVFDNPKYENSVTMMKNCTKAFKKIKNREGLKWTMIYFDRNLDTIEDAKCAKRAPAQRKATKKGIENKCNILFMDSSSLCRNGKFKRNRNIQAQFIDLCAEKGALPLYPVKMKAGSLTCKFKFSDEHKDSTPVGAFVTKSGKSRGKSFVAYGLNESNYMADALPAVTEKKILEKLTKKQTLVVNAGPEKYFHDPSLCMNGRPEKWGVKKSAPEVRAPASKAKAKAKMKPRAPANKVKETPAKAKSKSKKK